VRLLLPPSETKSDGGINGTRLDLTALTFPELTPERTRALSALRVLSRNLGASASALGLGLNRRTEIERNRAVTTSPVCPAVDRYTGVLYEALAAESPSDSERQFAGRHVLIHSALFGLVSASDLIPAYRLSYNSRLPGLSLTKLWRTPIAGLLARERGLVLDLRSESYAKLGPLPETGWYVHVVSEGADGRRTALSHFNKKAKGMFARAVIDSGEVHESVESLVAWAGTRGIRLEFNGAGVLDLVV
jgi:cytoplasmic iron level regulating protein YaaA (DUF328/UPF0246 family)